MVRIYEYQSKQLIKSVGVLIPEEAKKVAENLGKQWHHTHGIVRVLREELKDRPGFPVLLLIAGNKEKETHEIIKNGLKDLPIRWELYGREYVYQTDFIADRMKALVNAYLKEKREKVEKRGISCLVKSLNLKYEPAK